MASTAAGPRSFIIRLCRIHSYLQMQTVETEGYDVKNALRARIMYLKRKLQDRPMRKCQVAVARAF